MRQQLAKPAPIAPEPEASQTPDSGCEQGDDKRQSDLCAQWKAADAAFDAARAGEWQVAIGWIGLALGGVTMFAAIFAALYAKRAAIATEETVGIAREAAAGASEALAIATRNASAAADLVKHRRKATQLDLRPWLRVEGNIIECGMDKDGFTFVLRVSLKNFGRSPATLPIVSMKYRGRTSQPVNCTLINTDDYKDWPFPPVFPGERVSEDFRASFTGSQMHELKLMTKNSRSAGLILVEIECVYGTSISSPTGSRKCSRAAYVISQKARKDRGETGAIEWMQSVKGPDDICLWPAVVDGQEVL